MKTKKEKINYRCALVSGASSGLGEEFAYQLAGICKCLILVARREDLLKIISEKILKKHPSLEVYYFRCDLTDSHSRKKLLEKLTEHSLSPDLLVNNAGMGDYGPFREAQWDTKVDPMLQLNVVALTHLTYSLLPEMHKQGRGAILNLSSLASTLPIPDFAVYAGSKAYVSSFSEAIGIELKGTGIKVLHVCPGPVPTGFGAVALRDGRAYPLPGRDMFYANAEKVVALSLLALEKNRASIFPTWRIRFLASCISLIPISLKRRILRMRRR